MIGLTGGRGTFTFEVIGNVISSNQNRKREFVGPDPRNEVTFVINDMYASLEPLDNKLMKKRKPTRSKYKNKKKDNKFSL